MVKKILKNLIIGGIIALAFFVVDGRSVFAIGGVGSWVAGLATDGVAWAIGKIAFLVGWLAGVIINLENYLLRWILEANFYLMDSEILERGWQISRDIANLGFALGMLIISIATIVGYEEYHAKRLLAKLIIAALLINFSLMICGIFVDFSGAFMKYFSDSWGGPAKLGSMLQAAVKAPKFYQGPSETAIETYKTKAREKGAKGLGVIFTAVGGIVFSGVFVVILAIVYGAMIFLFLVRYSALLFLMIVSPFAWIFWFLPGPGGEEPGGIWRRWWDSFLKWIFFGPVMLFFVFLALLVLDPSVSGGSAEFKAAQRIDADPGLQKNITLGLAGLAKDSSPHQGISWLIQYAVVIVILFGGMKFALEIGAYGAGVFYGAGERVAKFPGKVAKKAGLMPIKRVGPSVAERAAMVGAKKLTPSPRASWLERVAKGVPRKLGLGYAIKKGIELGERQRREVYEQAKKMASYSKEVLETYLNTGNSQEKASALLALAEKGIWDPSYAKYQPVLERFKIPQSEIYKKNFLAHPVYREIAERIKKVKGESPELAMKLKEKLEKTMGEMLGKMRKEEARQQNWSAIISSEPEFVQKEPSLSYVYEAFHNNLLKIKGPVFSEILKTLSIDEIMGVKNRILLPQLKRLAGPTPSDWEDWLKKNNPTLYNYLKSNDAQKLGIGLKFEEEERK